MLILYQTGSLLPHSNSKINSVCGMSSCNSFFSALLLDSYSSPSSASPTEWLTSPVRSIAFPGTMSLWYRNCNPVSHHTIHVPHHSCIPTLQKCVISPPIVFEIPLLAPVFNSHPKSRPQK